MSANLSLTESQVVAALGNVLTSILPAGVAVVRGQINRVVTPATAFVVMQPILRERLSTNRATNTDTTLSLLNPTKITVQCDCHGAGAADNAHLIATLIRDPVGCSLFSAQGVDVQPLYASEPKQIPFVTGEQQYEPRWSIDVVVQANIVASLPVQTASQIAITATGLVEVDTAYHP